jgi:hypothetical protein
VARLPVTESHGHMSFHGHLRSRLRVMMNGGLSLSSARRAAPSEPVNASGLPKQR